MKACSGGDAGSADVAGVGGNFGLVQDDMHGGSFPGVSQCTVLYKQLNCIFLTTVVSYHKRYLRFNMGNTFSVPGPLFELKN